LEKLLASFVSVIGSACAYCIKVVLVALAIYVSVPLLVGAVAYLFAIKTKREK